MRFCHELREHVAGLNCGRWDYTFSFVKTFREHPDFLLPDRGLCVVASRPAFPEVARRSVDPDLPTARRAARWAGVLPGRRHGSRRAVHRGDLDPDAREGEITPMRGLRTELIQVGRAVHRSMVARQRLRIALQRHGGCGHRRRSAARSCGSGSVMVLVRPTGGR